MARLAALTLLVGWFPLDSSGQYFVDVAEQAGLGTAVHTNGVAVADYDGDGDLDVFTVPVRQFDEQDPSTWHRLFRNDGSGRFTDVSEAAGINARTVSGWPVKSFGNRYAVAWGDYDRDGDPDVVLTGVGPELLYRNNGDGTFSDVTDASGINPPAGSPDETETAGATWWDFDSDGYLDLYFSNWSGANRLHRNLGDGTFEDVSSATGTADTSKTWSALPIDFNGDGLLDLYVVNDFGPNLLYVANGDGTFTDQGRNYRADDDGDGMGVDAGDVNGDGLFDLYTTSIDFRKPNALLVRAGDHFEDVAEFLGVAYADWAWGAEFFDADHDGDEDLYVVNGHALEADTPNRFWTSQLRQTGTPQFVPTNNQAGAGSRIESRGLVAFDYDGDGDLDMAVSTWNAPLLLYQNRSAPGGWIQLALRGQASNLEAYGAVIRIWSEGRLQIRSHDGVDFAGQSIVPVHFGIGAASLVDSVQVTWPSGGMDVWYDMVPGAVYTLSEGLGTARERPHSKPEPSVYPNPTRGIVTISGLSPDIEELRLFDVLGREVSRVVVRGSSTVTLTPPSPGLYFLRAVDRIGGGQVQRLIAY